MLYLIYRKSNKYAKRDEPPCNNVKYLIDEDGNRNFYIDVNKIEQLENIQKETGCDLLLKRFNWNMLECQPHYYGVIVICDR